MDARFKATMKYHNYEHRYPFIQERMMTSLFFFVEKHKAFDC